MQIILAVVPSQFYIPTPAYSVNGSSATGFCSHLSTDQGRIACQDPTSSVLFDGRVPTLAGLEGDEWASQLLMMETSVGRPASLTVDFTNDYAGVRMVELVFFNCPKWGIGTDSIELIGNSYLVSVVHVHTSSCDSLVRLCLSNIWTTQRQLELRFRNMYRGTRWIGVAEVKFFWRRSGCLPHIIVPTPAPDTTATTTTSTTTTTTSPGSKYAHK